MGKEAPLCFSPTKASSCGRPHTHTCAHVHSHRGLLQKQAGFFLLMCTPPPSNRSHSQKGCMFFAKLENIFPCCIPFYDPIPLCIHCILSFVLAEFLILKLNQAGCAAGAVVFVFLFPVLYVTTASMCIAKSTCCDSSLLCTSILVQ